MREIKDKLIAIKLFPLYQKAINDIDDYFEYRYLNAGSMDDIKRTVDEILSSLAKAVANENV